MGGGGGGASTTVSQNPIPDYAQPFVQNYLRRANDLASDNGGLWPDYPGDTYASQNTNETDGIAALALRARRHVSIAGAQIPGKGETLLRSELDGDYLNNNPKMVEAYNKRRDQLLQEFRRTTLPNLHRSFAMMGRYGGVSHHIVQHIEAERLAQALADLSIEIFGENYSQERERRISAWGYGITYGTEDLKDADFLRQAGLYEREYTQGLYTTNYQLWKAEQVAGAERLQILTNAVRAMVGSISTETRPFFQPGTMSQLAGLALSGLSMYSMLYGKESNAEKMAAAGLGISSQNQIPRPEQIGRP